jgi:putative intracellular protease/amidase
MTASAIKELAATGDVVTRSAGLHVVTLTGGSDAATLVVKAGGSSGTTVLTVKVAAATTVAVPGLDGVLCPGGIHATLTGTNPAASFVYA